MSSVGRDYGRDSVVDVLSLAWHRLRLSVRAPSRCPSWDAIILTAASPTQALLYTTQLEAAKANGRIAEGTLVLAVPDPDGRRIGSGGATLGALRALSSLLASMPEEVEEGKQGQEHEGEGEEEKEEEVEEEEDLLLAVEERANEQQQKPQQQQQEEEQQQQQEQQEQQQEQQAEQQQLQPQREPGGPARQEGKEGARAARSRRSRSSSSSSSGGGGSSSSCRRSSSSRRRRAAFRALEGMRVLLVHAGGDSKRVPWANPMGKPFVPLPLLADEDPDGPAPSLFDHILAIAAPAVDAIGHGGGMLIMTGDVLPCFNASRLTIPPDAACVVTVPTPLDVATRHGVVLTTGATVPPGATAALISAEERLQSQLAASADPAQQEQAQEQEEQPQSKPQPPAGVDSARVNGGSTPVVDLLQKPSVQEMVDRGAIVGSGAALLDTGIFAARGATWRDLIGMAVADPDPVVALMKTGEEMSLYEELAGSWVPARHAWLRGRPLGRQLIASLGKSALYTHIAEELVFLHFGTSGEILDHLGEDHSGRLVRRHLSAVAAATECHVAPSAVLVSAEVHAGASVGEGTLVSSSILSPGSRIGSRCVVVAVDSTPGTSPAASAMPPGTPEVGRGAAFGRTAEASAPDPDLSPGALAEGGRQSPAQHVGGGPHAPAQRPASSLVVPDHCCLWQVPLQDRRELTLCCGVDDNPKDRADRGGTFCGRPWGDWMAAREIRAGDIWPHLTGGGEAASGSVPPGDLWGARLFCALPRGEGLGLQLAAWLMSGAPAAPPGGGRLLATWRACERFSLSQAHALIDFPGLHKILTLRRSDLIFRIACVSILGGSLGRDLTALCGQLLQAGEAGRQQCRELAILCSSTYGCSFEEFSVTGNLLREEEGSGEKVLSDRNMGGARRAETARPRDDMDGGEGGEGGGREAGVNVKGEGEEGRGGHVAREHWAAMPASRVQQALADLWRACGEDVIADRCQVAAWEAVADETAVAVGWRTDGGEGTAELAAVAASGGGVRGVMGGGQGQLAPGSFARVVLPVRLDVAGGWSDTPPWSLERVGTVLNLAVTLEGAPPVGARVAVTSEPGITIRDDAGGVCHISNPAPLLGQLSAQEDSFCLAKAALLVTGFARDARLWGSPEGDATSAAPARGGEGGVGADAARLRGSAEGAATSASREEGEGDGDGEEEGGGQGEEAGGREGGGGGPAEAAAGSGQATGGGVCGLEIETWADVPRGSGLGTSSILAAALVKALLQVRKGSLLGLGQEEISSSSTPGQVENSERMPGAAAGSPNPASASVSSLRSGAHSGADTNTGTGGTLTGPSGQPEQHGQPGADPSGVPVSNEEVSQLVLLLEQRMGTGGGWQDQVGGLYPGVKCTTSVPTRPLHLTVSSVPLLPDLLGQLHARLVVVFTGQVRLAWNVLHKVVGRYLQRDARTIAAVLRLTKLAGEGRQALAIGSLDALGRVMSDTWRLHQELDPHCTSPAVEALFARVRHLSAGAKLVGAGGGGFAIILATSKATAVEIRRELAAVGDPVRVYNWRLCDGSS